MSAIDREVTNETVLSGKTVAVGSADLLPTMRLPATIEPKKGLRLGTRFFLRAAGLVGVTLGVALSFASYKADRLTQQKIVESLQAVPDIFRGYCDSQAITRRSAVRARAEDAGTKALLGEPGVTDATFHDSAVEFAEGLSAGKVFFFDGQGKLIARSDRGVGEDRGRDFSQVPWVNDPLNELGDSSAFILDLAPKTQLSLLASAPVTQGAGGETRLNGVLAAAYPLEEGEALRLSRLTSGETILVANVAERGAPAKLEVLATSPRLKTLLGAKLPTLAGLLTGPVGPVLSEKKAVDVLELTLSGESWIGTALPILSAAGEPLASLVVLKSKDAELAPFRELQKGLVLVGIALLLVALPVSLGLARQISRPIEQLAEGAEAIRRGRLDVTLPEAGDDEVGALSRAFTGLVRELKEKAALEEVVAEMQRRVHDLTQGRRAGADPAPLAEATDAGGGPFTGGLFASRYEVLDLLGRGGMGKVFRAYDRELEEEVALKVLAEGETEETQSAIAALKQEIRTARKISHPNVIRTHDLGESGGVRFLTMEFVSGVTLRELTSKLGRLDLVPGLQIAKQICRGLDAVHEAGIVHRDLKPQNVMVMGNGVVKLMDFGIAQAASSEGVGPGGATEGTPYFMSPEQIQGQAITPASDLYSTGLVLFEMFTGKHPFAGSRGLDEVFRDHVFTTPVSVRSLRPDLPEPLAQAIATCLQKDPAKRPGSAADLERALTTITG